MKIVVYDGYRKGGPRYTKDMEHLATTKLHGYGMKNVDGYPVVHHAAKQFTITVDLLEVTDKQYEAMSKYYESNDLVEFNVGILPNIVAPMFIRRPNDFFVTATFAPFVYSGDWLA
jgi:hypothetical protein